jgi:hypothetical protein
MSLRPTTTTSPPAGASKHGAYQGAADLPVGFLKTGRQRPPSDRRDNRVGELEVVQQSSTTCRAAYDVDAFQTAEIEIGGLDALVAADGQARRIPAVEAQGRWGLALRNGLQHRHVARHVVGAGEITVNDQSPGRGVSGHTPEDSKPASASRFGEDGATLRIVCPGGVTGFGVVESNNANGGTCVVEAPTRISPGGGTCDADAATPSSAEG